MQNEEEIMGYNQEDWRNVDDSDNSELFVNMLDATTAQTEVNRYKKKTYQLLNIASGSSVLDIGCGTGAFSASFSTLGHDVTGVDIAEKMIKYALKRGVKSLYGNVVDGLNFPDKSFDMVMSALVVHGLDREKRKKLLEEAARLSRGIVLFHDYNSKRNKFISIIEYLEDGDYFNFIENGLSEMKGIFSKVKVIPVRKYNNWYVCTP